MLEQTVVYVARLLGLGPVTIWLMEWYKKNEAKTNINIYVGLDDEVWLVSSRLVAL